jgi:membrane dipeptidase
MMELHEEHLSQARELHRRALLIDAHVDTTQRLLQPDFDIAARHNDGHVDLPRLREGGAAAVFMAVYASGPLAAGEGVRAARYQLNQIETTVGSHRDALAPARSAAEVRAAKSAGRIAVLVGIEGGYLIEDSLDHLREYRQRGAMYLTLTHGFHTTWADSAGIHDPLGALHGGLTPFGREVIIELNRLGMMVDVSHASDDTVRDVLEVSVAPVIASHSSCREVAHHRRNLTDRQIKAIAKSGGVVCINFAAAFVDPAFPEVTGEMMKAWRESAQSGGRGGEAGQAPNKPLDHQTPFVALVDHFDHALQLVGPNHVGIGSDFDGVLMVPDGMEDCSRLPHLTAGLLQRGYNEADLTKVLGGNVLRVMDACAEVSRRLSRAHAG